MVLKKPSECGVDLCDTVLLVVLWGLSSLPSDQSLGSSVGRAVDLERPWSRVQIPLEMTFSELKKLIPIRFEVWAFVL